MADEDDDETTSEESEEEVEDDEDDDGVDDEVDDDESVLDGDDELDADEKAMLDGAIDDDDEDEDDDVRDEEIDDEQLKPITESEQRRAGWSCLFLLIAVPVSVWYGAKAWLASALEIDQTNVPQWYLEAVRNDAIALQDPDAAFVRPVLEAEWLTDLDEALEKAQEGEKPLIVAFVDEGSASEQMFRGTWLNRDVVHLLRDAVALRLELGDETTSLAERFQVTSAPTTLFLTPDLERLRPDTARVVDATDMEIYLYETLENMEERRLYREHDPLQDEPPDEPRGEGEPAPPTE